MKEIALRNGGAALVDDEDFDRLAPLYWRQIKGRALTYQWVDGRQVWTFMHRMILVVPDEKDVDHANGNTLDNRRTNLREATRTQNMANVRKARGGCPLKGVKLNRRGKWEANICFRGKNRHLGSYGSPEEAARAYDAAAIETFGEFAATNAALGLL